MGLIFFCTFLSRSISGDFVSLVSVINVMYGEGGICRIDEMDASKTPTEGRGENSFQAMGSTIYSLRMTRADLIIVYGRSEFWPVRIMTVGGGC